MESQGAEPGLGTPEEAAAVGLAVDYQRSGWGIHGNLNVTLSQADQGTSDFGPSSLTSGSMPK